MAITIPRLAKGTYRCECGKTLTCAGFKAWVKGWGTAEEKLCPIVTGHKFEYVYPEGHGTTGERD